MEMKRLGIVGMGKSGQALEAAWQKLGGQVFIYDSNLSENTLADINQIDILCISPGINLLNCKDKQIIQFFTQAKANKIDIVNDIELYFQFFSPKVIAVTGSYGKSTVCSMISFLLNKLEIKNSLRGNIGIPIWQDPFELESDEVLVLEVSSAQLLFLRSLKAEVGALLNIYPHHLDFHQNDISHYIGTKRKLLDMSNKTVLDMKSLSRQLDNYYPDANKMNTDTLKIEIPISPISEIKKIEDIDDIDDLDIDIEIIDDEDFDNEAIKQVSEEVIDHDPVIIEEQEIPAPKFAKIYTVEQVNAAYAATIVCEFLEDFAKFEELYHLCIKDFDGLKHRNELIYQDNQLSVINDSKATDVHPMMMSILQTPNKCILLCGGAYNASAIENWMLLKDSKIIRKIYRMIVFGESGKYIYQKIKSFMEVTMADSLEEACKIAYSLSEKILSDHKKRACILLSPGCQSFDQFKNFEERGDKFAQIMFNLLHKYIEQNKRRSF